MLDVKLYSPENMSRAKYAQIGAVLLAVAVCGHLAFTCVSGMRDVLNAKKQLEKAKKEANELCAKKNLTRREVRNGPRYMDGGIENFTIAFSGWSRERKIFVDSIVPEGEPSATEVSVGQEKLGVWNAHKVRVKGVGEYPDVMSLMKEFKDPVMPVQLESFALESAMNIDGRVKVGFNLVVKVFEKKDEAKG